MRELQGHDSRWTFKNWYREFLNFRELYALIDENYPIGDPRRIRFIWGSRKCVLKISVGKMHLKMSGSAEMAI